MPSISETESIIKKKKNDDKRIEDNSNSFTYHLSIIVAKNKLYFFGIPIGIIVLIGVIFIILFAAGNFHLLILLIITS